MPAAVNAEPPSSSTALVVGAVREVSAREHRVALDPDVTSRLVKAGFAVVIECGGGTDAGFSDAAYRAAGASVLQRKAVLASADVLAVVRPPRADLIAQLHHGQLLVGLVEPLTSGALLRQLAEIGVTVAAFELLPRTLSRAQSMDAVSSQASAAGYRAAISAAAAFGRYLPMMITASGTAKPASVIVVGAGIAGLQAIATLKRLGAVVTGYDVRPASRGEVESLGATFLTSSVADGAGDGGYARAMTAEESVHQQDELAAHLRTFDVIITTAKVPGGTPPLLVTAATLAALKPGTVCIDLAAGEQRGNVAGSMDGVRTVTDAGVIVIGAGNLPSELATSSSAMYARNVFALLTSLAPSGHLAIDLSDEIQAAVIVAHDGALTAAAPSTPTGVPVA